MADERVAKKIGVLKSRIDKLRGDLFDKGRPIVKEGVDEVDASLGPEWVQLGDKVLILKIVDNRCLSWMG
jgi:hypothetical protein